jgi:hypothetical protein
MYHYQQPENLNGIVYNIGTSQPTKAERLKKKAEKRVEAMIRLLDRIEELERQGKIAGIDFMVSDNSRIVHLDPNKAAKRLKALKLKEDQILANL